MKLAFCACSYFFFSLELLLALFLARGENAVKTGACVAWVCVLGAVSSGCSVAPLTVAPFFLLQVTDLFPVSKGSELLSADMWSRLTSETKWPHVSWS